VEHFLIAGAEFKNVRQKTAEMEKLLSLFDRRLDNVSLKQILGSIAFLRFWDVNDKLHCTQDLISVLARAIEKKKQRDGVPITDPDFMYHLSRGFRGLCHMDLKTKAEEDLVNSFADVMKDAPNVKSIGWFLCMCLSLESMPSESKAFARLLDGILRKSEDLKSIPLSSDDLFVLLKCLQKKSLRSDPVRRYLDFLASWSTTTMSRESPRYMLNQKRMVIEFRLFREIDPMAEYEHHRRQFYRLIDEIANRISIDNKREKDTHIITGGEYQRHIGRAFLGLQNLHNDRESVRKVLRYFRSVLETKYNREGLDCESMENILQGMKRMRKDCKEVRVALGMVARNIKAIDTISGSLISIALYNHRSEDIQIPEVSQLLEAIDTKIHASKVTGLHPRAVSTAIYGLHSVGDGDIGRSLLSGIIERIDNFDDYGGQHLSQILFGLQSFENNDETVKFIGMVMDRPLKSATKNKNDQAMLNQNIRILIGLKRPFYETLPPRLKRDLLMILKRSLTNKRSVSPHGSTRHERTYFDYAKAALVDYRSDTVEIYRGLNNILHDFEADIVLSVKKIGGESDGTAGKTVVVNIEIDGPLHKEPRRSRFNELRDEYLEKCHGVITRRWCLQSLYKVKMRVKKAEYDRIVTDKFRGIVDEVISNHLS
jgi:hypothetical protein